MSRRRYWCDVSTSFRISAAIQTDLRFRRFREVCPGVFQYNTFKRAKISSSQITTYTLFNIILSSLRRCSSNLSQFQCFLHGLPNLTVKSLNCLYTACYMWHVALRTQSVYCSKQRELSSLDKADSLLPLRYDLNTE